LTHLHSGQNIVIVMYKQDLGLFLY